MRKPKLTPELLSQITTALQAHSTVKATCDMLGISEESFYRWKREGEAANGGIKREFYESVKRAQGMSTIMLINSISKDPSWQAKAWLLERMHPKEFGRRQLLAHAGADGESDLPIPTGGTAAAVNLTINMQRPDQDSPWIFREGQDQDPANGSDPWETDHHGFDPTASPEPLPDQAAVERQAPHPAAQPVAPTRGPNLPPRTPQAPHGLDTGGRPRDPDDHE